MPTVSEAWQNASKLIDRFEAKLLLASCLGVNRTYLITHDKDVLAESVFNHYKDCVQKRAFPFHTFSVNKNFMDAPLKSRRLS